MSIIYDALTKVQRSRRSAEKIEFDFERKNRAYAWFDRILIIAIASLIIILIYGYSSIMIKKRIKIKSSSSAVPIVHTIQAKPVPVLKYTTIDYTGAVILNGIFISDNDRFAIINNQTVHVGDVVNNKKIVIINYNNIILKDNMYLYVIKNKAIL